MNLPELLDALDEYDARKAARLAKASAATAEQLSAIVAKGVAKALGGAGKGATIQKAEAPAPPLQIRPADAQMAAVQAMLNRRRAAGQ